MARVNRVNAFPTDRIKKHRVLMDAVESVRDTLEAGAEESERIGTLAPASVDALYESGLLRLKMPHALGGAEADVVTQLDVLEAVSLIDPASGWCLMIGAASLGSLGAFLPDDSIEEIFVGGKPPKTAGAAAPSATATPVDGGYRVTGHWRFGSGIMHAEWVSAGARVVGELEGYPRQVRMAMSRKQVKVHDNWQVMGLRGTGSCDFSVEDLFVPDGFAWDATLTEPLRGRRAVPAGPAGLRDQRALGLRAGRRAAGAGRGDRGGGVQDAGLQLGEPAGEPGDVPAGAGRMRYATAGGAFPQRGDPGRGVAISLRRPHAGAAIAGAVA